MVERIYSLSGSLACISLAILLNFDNAIQHTFNFYAIIELEAYKWTHSKEIASLYMLESFISETVQWISIPILGLSVFSQPSVTIY
jgi:hypothetical protein